MAAKIPSSVCMILMVVATTMVAVFVSTGEAAPKYGMCQSECMNIKPNCNAWCKRIGYPNGGECIEPHLVDCCCWEVPPSDEKWNGTAGGMSHALHM
ncbi:hypothetical protein ACP4OV_002247 [Aristida adscensionis]